MHFSSVYCCVRIFLNSCLTLLFQHEINPRHVIWDFASSIFLFFLTFNIYFDPTGV